jgi:CheY-like chemotaxis protein
VLLAGDVDDVPMATLARAFRSDAKLRDTARILLTTRAQLGESEPVDASGFDAYLTRPPRPSQLYETLDALRSKRPEHPQDA